ncbi:serine hydrolase domain-containing protein [Lysobacter korlensis]|uniref:Serine hydrolase domain-containing protein n=1 Tax=Lysobacter korlensis TaxID=553636 RepID=A0ABV6RP51_9GAMM
MTHALQPGRLPRATPSSQGVDARGIEAFLDALERDPDIEPHSMMLLRHGQVIAAGWWAPFTPERPHLLYSLSKTFTATALGFAVDEGLLDLDELVVDAFPEFAEEIVTPRARSIRVRHLAAMSSGHTQEMLDVALETDPAEPVRGFLLHEPEQEPGTIFAYSQPCTYTVAAILQRRAGTDLVGYLRPRLFDPLGIPSVGWESHPDGRSIGFSGLYATTEAIAKLGQLYLDGGRWNGEQLLPAGWVEQVSTRWIDTPREGSPDWACGYGFQVWHARHGYRGDGAFGQFCVILPEQDVVLATTASTEAMQSVLDAVWTHLLPAMAEDPGDAGPDADARLAERLTGLRLPTADGPAAPPDGADPAGGYAVLHSPEGPVVEAVDLAADGDGWRVRLVEDGLVAAEARLDGSGWNVGEADGRPPIAVTGGWRNGRLHLSVLMMETPHRLEFELDPGTREAVARWTPPPLSGPDTRIRELQAPRPLR